MTPPATRQAAVLGVIDSAETAAIAPDLTVTPLGALSVVTADAGAPRAALVAAARRAAASVAAFLPVAPAPISAAAAEVWLQKDEALLRDALRRLRGCAEWVATVTGTPDPDAAPAPCTEIKTPGPGASWLRARAARQRAQDAAAARSAAQLRALAEDLAPLTRAVAVTPFVGPRGAGADLAILAPRGAGPAIALRVSQHPGVALTGPWPAYSFAAGTDA